MVIRAYERCSKWQVCFSKDNFKSEELRQERYNKWLTDLKNNYKVHTLISIDDNGVETVIKETSKLN